MPRPKERKASAFAPAGAAPLALMHSMWLSGRTTIAKRSPPTAHMCGYATVRKAAAPSAASTAFPPRSNMSSPASVAPWWGDAIAKRLPVEAVDRGEPRRLVALIDRHLGSEPSRVKDAPVRELGDMTAKEKGRADLMVRLHRSVVRPVIRSDGVVG